MDEGKIFACFYLDVYEKEKPVYILYRGDTKPIKDELKAQGFKWKLPPEFTGVKQRCWVIQQPVSFTEISYELGTAYELGAETRNYISRIDYKFWITEMRKEQNLIKTFLGGDKDFFDKNYTREEFTDLDRTQMKDFFQKEENKNVFALYQVKNDKEHCFLRYQTRESIVKNNIKIDSVNYDLVYYGKIDDFTTTEETTDQGKILDLQVEMNIVPPANYEGRFISVSDVIVYKNDKGEIDAYYLSRAPEPPIKITADEFFYREWEESREKEMKIEKDLIKDQPSLDLEL